MGKVKNIFNGIFWAMIGAVMYIVLPYTALYEIRAFSINGIQVDFQHIDAGGLNFSTITFYIEAIGLIMVSFYFAKGTSPSHSTRRAVFSLLIVLGSGAYIYIIRYSGISKLPIELGTFGTMTVDITEFMDMMFGVIMLNSLLSIIDIGLVIYDHRVKNLACVDTEKKEEKTQEQVVQSTEETRKR
jgi:hypothetical protein